MNEIFNSKAFQEFLQKRCEEITGKDKEYQKITESILQIENELQPLLPHDVLKILEKYEKLNLNLIAHTQYIIYAQAIKDFKIGG